MVMYQIQWSTEDQSIDCMPNWYTILKRCTHAIKPSVPLLLADGTLRCGMYPAGKVAMSQYLATPGFPQCDHTIGKLSAEAGSLCSEVKQTS